MQAQWKVEAADNGAPLTVTMQVAQVTVATTSGEQITLTPQQLAPLAERLDSIDDYLTHGD